MIVCPVCEHPQAQGTECEVCGRSLAEPAASSVSPVGEIDGLERTALEGAVVGGVAPMPDLEPTLQAPVGAGDDAVPDLEATAAAPVDVDVAPDPELERTGYSGLPVDDAFALPAIPLCRYCRTPATADERICSRCGMRLPVARAAVPEAIAEARLCSCGMPLAPGATRCPSCGSRSG